MKDNKQRRYYRLTKAERFSIEHGLDARKSARSMAKELGRSPSSIADEVRRNRTVSKGSGKGERASAFPEGEIICPRLEAWPWVCNGCKYRHYHCSRKWRCEYSSLRAQALATSELHESRKGANAREEDFEHMMALIRSDVARGMSPARIVAGRAGEFCVHPSTVYRWIAAGYGGMSNVELRRQVGYKPRATSKTIKQTSHGEAKSYAAFLELGEDLCAAACEMDTVIGRSCDTQCILTLFLKPSKMQIALLLGEKTPSAVAAALDSLEKAIGKKTFQHLFGLILTDNGVEFSDTDALERSAIQGSVRTQVYYCDVRQSQQKAGCERNHVELRKILPKGRKIAFDELVTRDMAVVMSHLNSEARPSLMGLSPIEMLRRLCPDKTTSLMSALGIEEIPYVDLNLTIDAINQARKKRGEEPLI
ncbi:MAG: helix-turn-helix domain-containing protein [Raoultibacter sp.]